MAAYSRLFSSQSLANSTSVASNGMDVGGRKYVMIFGSVDNGALTVQPQVSPLSLRDSSAPPDGPSGNTGWYNFGSALNLTANGVLAFQVGVEGAASFRVVVANASGGTRVFTLDARPSPKLPL